MGQIASTRYSRVQSHDQRNNPNGYSAEVIISPPGEITPIGKGKAVPTQFADIDFWRTQRLRRLIDEGSVHHVRVFPP